MHSCCAPCSSYVMEYLSAFFELTMYFYNPNIDSLGEYNKRALELQRLINEMGLTNKVKLVIGKYDPGIFLKEVSGHENDPEGGFRCKICYRLRLKETACFMKKYNSLFPQTKYDFFATTLTLSPLKNAVTINEIGDDVAKSFKLNYLETDFKKNDGFKKSIFLSRKYGLYRQNYCGCGFSKRIDRMTL